MIGSMLARRHTNVCKKRAKHILCLLVHAICTPVRLYHNYVIHVTAGDVIFLQTLALIAVLWSPFCVSSVLVCAMH
jgi:hypothetical protein